MSAAAFLQSIRMSPGTWRHLVGAVMVFAVTSACAQGKAEALHGADGIFVSPDVAIVWAVLKQPSGDKATVWLRVVNSARKFSHISVDGVDPFSQKRERVEAGMPLVSEVRIQSDRDTFSDLPSREVHFYRTEGDWKADKPGLTVYYLGVPDTTPEFSERSVLDDYLKTARLVPHKRQQRK